MPDGLTHVLTSYIGGRRWLKGANLALFLFGSLLPDIFLRGGRLLFVGLQEKDFLELYLVPLHTPVTCLFMCFALVQFLHRKMRSVGFSLLYGGCLAHFSLDFLQCTICGYGFTFESIDGYHWLFPFSWLDFQFGLFWIEQVPYGLVILTPISLFIFINGLRRGNRKKLESWGGVQKN